MSARTFPRLAPRRSGGRSSWWGRAWQRTVEESTYADADLTAGRRAARAGRVGAIGLSDGRCVAAVESGDDALTAQVLVRAFDAGEQETLLAAVESEAGRIADLLAGQLPDGLVEHAEESGIDLVPGSGDVSYSCSCEPWADPCQHAVALATQVGWLLDEEPLLLLALRGFSRTELLDRLDERRSAAARTATGSAAGSGDDDGPQADPDPDEIDDLAVAQDAALRAERLLQEWG